jgi:hypothetical protein
MAGLVPAIHGFPLANAEDVDARNKSGHDGARSTGAEHPSQKGLP